VVALAEFDLKLPIEVEIGLRDQCSVEAFLLRDFTKLRLDRDAFMDERRQARLRFSVAHELGHFFLHSGIFKGLAFASVDEWVNFIKLVPDKEYGWIEFQAYEFAGRLLVPPTELSKQLKGAVKKAEAAGFTDWDKSGEAAIAYIAAGICEAFEVSDAVISKRIRSEGLWPPR